MPSLSIEPAVGAPYNTRRLWGRFRDVWYGMKGASDPLPLTVVWLQAAGALVVAMGLWFFDPAQALAAFLAGAVVVVPNGYFAWRVGVERSPGRLLAHGVMRFVVTVVLMALTFVVFRPAPLGFFSAFVLMQAMYAAGPLLIGRSTPRR
jgi:F0F1-type ATP synthase assembly protein I